MDGLVITADSAHKADMRRVYWGWYAAYWEEKEWRKRHHVERYGTSQFIKTSITPGMGWEVK